MVHASLMSDSEQVAGQGSITYFPIVSARISSITPAELAGVSTGLAGGESTELAGLSMVCVVTGSLVDTSS